MVILGPLSPGTSFCMDLGLFFPLCVPWMPLVLEYWTAFPLVYSLIVENSFWHLLKKCKL